MHSSTPDLPLAGYWLKSDAPPQSRPPFDRTAPLASSGRSEVRWPGFPEPRQSATRTVSHGLQAPQLLRVETDNRGSVHARERKSVLGKVQGLTNSNCRLTRASSPLSLTVHQ
jgi:hypothetical protein